MDALHRHSLKAHCGSPVTKPDFRHNCAGLRRAGHWRAPVRKSAIDDRRTTASRRHEKWLSRSRHDLKNNRREEAE
jgi:hypothetical protein